MMSSMRGKHCKKSEKNSQVNQNLQLILSSDNFYDFTLNQLSNHDPASQKAIKSSLSLSRSNQKLRSAQHKSTGKENQNSKNSSYTSDHNKLEYSYANSSKFLEEKNQQIEEQREEIKALKKCLNDIKNNKRYQMTQYDRVKDEQLIKLQSIEKENEEYLKQLNILKVQFETLESNHQKDSKQKQKMKKKWEESELINEELTVKIHEIRGKLLEERDLRISMEKQEKQFFMFKDNHQNCQTVASQKDYLQEHNKTLEKKLNQYIVKYNQNHRLFVEMQIKFYKMEKELDREKLQKYVLEERMSQRRQMENDMKKFIEGNSDTVKSLKEELGQALVQINNLNSQLNFYELGIADLKKKFTFEASAKDKQIQILMEENHLKSEELNQYEKMFRDKLEVEENILSKMQILQKNIQIYQQEVHTKQLETYKYKAELQNSVIYIQQIQLQINENQENSCRMILQEKTSKDYFQQKYQHQLAEWCVMEKKINQYSLENDTLIQNNGLYLKEINLLRSQVENMKESHQQNLKEKKQIQKKIIMLEEEIQYQANINQQQNKNLQNVKENKQFFEQKYLENQSIIERKCKIIQQLQQKVQSLKQIEKERNCLRQQGCLLRSKMNELQGAMREVRRQSSESESFYKELSCNNHNALLELDSNLSMITILKHQNVQLQNIMEEEIHKRNIIIKELIDEKKVLYQELREK